MLVDSHCHLNYKAGRGAAGGARRARAAGVTAFLNILHRQGEWGDVVGTAEREPDVWASIGIHPHEAEQHADLGEGALIAARHTRG
jgi:TatD DNase family protein